MENSFIIENLLRQSEGLRLEFTANTNFDHIAKSITSFINAQGGDLVIGITHKKEIVGVENVGDYCLSLQAELVKRIKPIAPINTVIVNYKKKNIILVSVWEGGRKPYLFDGIIYNRSGKSAKPAKPEDITELIAERKNSDFNWERQIVLGAELSDLDIDQINKAIALYNEYKKDANIEIGDIDNFLIQNGLMQNGDLTNACIVLFGKNPVRFIQQSKIRLTLYPSVKSGDTLMDDRIYDQCVFRNIENLFDDLDVIYGKSSIIRSAIREERYHYPLKAVREGIMNAVVHRDYNSFKGFLHISIYSDRTEISNYGGLPEGVSINELTKEHNSILRNPDIATMCLIHKRVELLGTGTLRMIRDCKENKFRVPTWKENDHIITVTFKGVTHNRKEEIAVTPPLEGVNRDILYKVEGVIEGVNEGVNEGVKDKLVHLCFVLYLNGGLNATAIEKQTNIPVKSVERYIKMLRDSGFVEFRGSPKAGGYYLTKKFNRNIR
jgi:ATP-dependent DNA helicase RecG